MSNPIVTVLKNAAKQMEDAAAKAGKAFTSCFRDAGTGLRNTAHSHEQNDAQHAGVFERTHNTAEPNVKPKGDAGTTPTSATPGPSTSKGWTPHNNTAEPTNATELHAKSSANEPKISQDMQDILGKTGGEAKGWEYRLKEPDSLNRKVDADAAKLARGLPEDKRYLAEQMATGKINDTVRYTMSFPKDTYTQGSQHAIDELTRKGYRPIDGKFKNTWGKEGYQGINSNWVDPATGQRFEVQFHTPESFYAKDEGTHHLYEQARVLPDGPAKDALNEQQRQIFADVPRPPGASGVAPPRQHEPASGS